MTQDERWLKALKIEPCTIQEPVRYGEEGSIYIEVKDGEVRMSFEDFSNFRNANSGLYSENQDLRAKNDLLTGLATQRAKDARKWRGAWFVAVAAMGAAVIVDVLR